MDDPPMTSKTPGERLAREIVERVRSGDLDPRPAADLLGLGFDQDDIMAIFEAAAFSGPTAPASGLGEEDVEREIEAAMAADRRRMESMRAAALSPPPRDGGNGLSVAESGAGSRQGAGDAAGDAQRKSEGGA